MNIGIEEIEKPLRVAIYLRVSTDDQVEKYGIDLQKSSILSFIKSKGKLDDGRDAMVLAGDDYIYIDDGISGTTELQDRVGFARLMEDLTNTAPGYKPFDVVAVYKVDRFARRLQILLDTVKFFEKHKIQFLSVNESIDTSTPFGRAILNFMGVVAELEIETTKLRVQDGRVEAQHQGKFMGVAPYGYTKNKNYYLVELPEESKHLRRIFNWFVFENRSSQWIANELEVMKVLTPDPSAIHYSKRKGEVKRKNSNYLWRAEKIREILSDEVYLGKLFYGKKKEGVELPKRYWKLSPITHPQLVEESVFEEARKKLKDSAEHRSLNRKREDDHLYLLTGLVKCSYCAGNDPESMFSWTGSRKNIGTKDKPIYSYYYLCGGKDVNKSSRRCPVIPLPADQLEEYIINFTKELLKNPKSAYEYQRNLKSHSNQIKQYKNERAQLKKKGNAIVLRRQRLSYQHEIGELTDAEFLERREQIVRETERFQARIKEIDQVLNEQALTEGQIRSFNKFSKKYAIALENVSRHRPEVYELLHILIDEIIVYTRTVSPLDRIAGKKKLNQQIPNEIEIKLKLQKELIVELAEKNAAKFVDKTATMYQG